MLMGYPIDTAAQPVFLFRTDTDAPSVDAYGVPWNPAGVGTTVYTEITGVLCAIDQVISMRDIETKSSSQQYETMLVTLLETEFQQVKDCVAIRYDGRVFPRWQTPPAIGLFAVGIHTIEFRANDA